MLFPETMMDAVADRAACRALLRTGSRTFYAAAHLLPRRVREPATALYAFCRIADDAIDIQAGPTAGGRRAALDRLRSRLDRVYGGTPLPQPADRAFAAVVADFAIPRDLPDALLEGLAWDVEGRRYETLADLHAYAARVAGSVGVMMALLMGVRDRTALACACSLGAAMQLTNIARDIGEDARAGRLYLPVSWLRAAGVDLERWMAAPTFDPAIETVTRRLLAEAERLYRISEAGIAALPASCRIGIRAARLLYAAIGKEVVRHGFDPVAARARVPAVRKLRIVLSATLPRPRLSQNAVTPGDLSAMTFLIDGVTPHQHQRRLSIGHQVGWVLDLFDRIEQRRRLLSTFDRSEAA